MGGISGYDWSVFGGNPAPGDPDAIRAIAVQLRNLADDVTVHNRVLRSVGDGTESVWSGPAASAFRPHLAELPGQLEKLVTSYTDAADGLDGYWTRLQAAQQLAVQAWHRAQSALADVRSAEGRVATAGAASAAASDAYNAAATAVAAAPPDPTGAAASHLASLQSDYQAASNQLAAAGAALAAARADLEAARAVADTARAQARTAAHHAAAALSQASKAGIHNPHRSWFSSAVDFVEGVGGDVVHFAEHNWKYAFPEVALTLDAGNWLEHHWVEALKVTSAVLGGIATVAGFLALVPGVGEIALPIALIASVGATVDDAVLAATHNGSWATVGLDAVGDLGFGAGEALTRTAEGINDAERLTGEATRLERATTVLSEQANPFREAASRWDSLGDSEVFQVGPGGETVSTKAADMARQTRSDAAPLEQRIADAESSLSKTLAKLQDLPGEGSANGLRYSLRTFDPRTDGNTYSKVANFVKDPGAYARQVLHPAAAEGEQAASGFRQVLSRATAEQLHGPATTLYRINVGVGLAGTGLGGYVDRASWADVFHRPGRAG